ncbi:MAG: hypothetical protein IPO58_23265 [Betaproteobacteria bacterium]|nr:hypothetical protein [Betaproteobacteria bacterium]
MPSIRAKWSKQALHHNNKRRGDLRPQPSVGRRAAPPRADELLTQALKSALDLGDITKVDHLVIAGNVKRSFRREGPALRSGRQKALGAASLTRAPGYTPRLVPILPGATPWRR